MEPFPSVAAPVLSPEDLANIDPDRLEAVMSRSRSILESGQIPNGLFICQTGGGLLALPPSGDQGALMLVFSNPFAATDYLRFSGIQGAVGQIGTEKFAAASQSWLSMGVKAALLDRCPRCPYAISIDVAEMAKWKHENFAKVWAIHRATRNVMSGIRLQSAMNHVSAGSHAAAQIDLEYVRDHFDCSVPYLHQFIGLLAGMQGDQAAKDASRERLREFGSQFEGPLDVSPELVSTAMVGLMASFGLLPASPKV